MSEQGLSHADSVCSLFGRIFRPKSARYDDILPYFPMVLVICLLLLLYIVIFEFFK